MPMHIFTVPFDPENEVFQDEDLRKFLLNKRVRALRPEFFQLHDRAYWSVFVEYDVVGPAAAGREVERLNEPQRLLFQRLREWRKETAEQAGFPVYVIATNSQLEQLAVQAPRTLEALRQIRGFGKKKLARHGLALIAIISAFYQPEPLGPEAPL
jgi:superfamily II DNA helicase RecQ